MAEPNEQEGKEQEGAKPEDEGLGDAGKRALEAERKARRKAEADLKAAREELAGVKADQDSSKSDVEKLTAKVEQLVTRAEEAELKALRSEVAQSKDLPPALARRLSGSTREEMESDADELLEALGSKKNDDAGAKPEGEGNEGEEGAKPDEDKRGTPRENLKPGASNKDEETPDAKKLADSILESGW